MVILFTIYETDLLLGPLDFEFYFLSLSYIYGFLAQLEGLAVGDIAMHHWHECDADTHHQKQG